MRKERSRAQLQTVTEELLEKDVSMITDGYYSDIQHFTTHSNLESGLLVNCLDQLCHIGIMDPSSGAILNTSLFQLYKE